MGGIMQIILKKGVKADEIQKIMQEIARYKGLTPHLIRGEELLVIPIVGIFENIDKKEFQEHLKSFSGVADVIMISSPYKLVSKECHNVVDIHGYRLGSKKIHIIAGPCSVESYNQLIITAEAVKRAGATFLRGGVYKPRTSPYAFRGLGEEALNYLKDVKHKVNIPVVTEVMRPEHIEQAIRYGVDVLQIGARNSQNFELLDEVGKSGKPVLLKNGLAGTIEELLLSAEYVAKGGNRNIILCLRGVRTFETETRNALDLGLIPALKEKTNLPIFVDPSHPAGKRSIVESLSMAAIAAGADGLLVEVHPEPEKAKSDGPQQLKPDQFTQLMEKLKKIAAVLDREI
jgi:3-deoxy-7-phosphoheptulonate synthase